jgi:hypothetical protein
LEQSDLSSLVQNSRVIIDVSGGHGGDDGRPDLRWIRYRPWAARIGAYVIVSNPVHDDLDFMGHSPWGGDSAVIRQEFSTYIVMPGSGSKPVVERQEREHLTIQENPSLTDPQLNAIVALLTSLLPSDTHSIAYAVNKG